MRLAVTIAAFICSATSFPFIGRKPDTSTIPADTWPRIAAPGRWYHDLKNLVTELYRADPQWWAKASAFSVSVLGISLIVSILA